MQAFPHYVSYRSSGVEWLGEIPSHWNLSKIKHKYDVQLGKMLQPNKHSQQEKEKPYLRAANVAWDGADLADVKSMWFSPVEMQVYSLQVGDVLISEGGDVGRACYWQHDIEMYFQNALTSSLSERMPSD